MVQAMLLNLLDLNLIKTRLTPLNIIKQQKTAALVWHLPSSLHLVGQEDWQTKRGEVVRVDLGVFLQKLLDSKTSRLFQISTSHHISPHLTTSHHIPSVTQKKRHTNAFAFAHGCSMHSRHPDFFYTQRLLDTETSDASAQQNHNMYMGFVQEANICLSKLGYSQNG